MRMRGGRQAVTFANPWRPIGIVAGTVALGLLLGILLGLQTCSPSGSLSAEKQDSYLVLAATLYSQGESLTALKVYLNPLASRDPATMILQLADRYEKSADRQKQQQAKDLRALGEALQLGREPEALATPQVSSPASASVTPTLGISTAASPTPAAPTPTTSSAPVAPKPAPNAQPTSTAIIQRTATPVPTAIAIGPQPALAGQAVARPTGNNGAIMRDKPSTTGAMVGSLSNGAKVEIIRVVQGEAVDPAEDRWYLITFENKTGYVYFKLLAKE